MPTSRIIYEEAEKSLYVGTELGMYKCDFSTFDPTATFTNSDGYLQNTSVQWGDFNLGLVSGADFPNIAATDLRINHCQGKLYAATYGRSVWVTDLYTSDAAPSVSDTIATNVTWNMPNMNIAGSVTILPGATLTITGDTVHMPRNGAINVQAGGKLVVDHAMITNDCSQCLWQGIVVQGDFSSPQTPANQGWAIIRNGSTIQHARVGISNTWNPSGTPGDDQYSRGIMQADNSTFLNNITAVASHANSLYTTSLYPDNSYFRVCRFVIDNNYKGNALGIPMQHFVDLQSVNGLSFAGCQFLNRDTAALTHGLGDGIHSYGSGFTVYGWSPPALGTPTYTRSKFIGLQNGLDLQGDISANTTIGVDMADFDTVSVGIYVAAQNHVSTTRCNFRVGNGLSVVTDASIPGGCYQNIGIYTQNAPRFRTEGNTFIGVPNSTSGWFNLGTVVANGGADNNKVYMNIYDSLHIGVASIGHNWNNYALSCSTCPATGLQVLCNTFAYNNYDIYLWGDPSSPDHQGMRPNQGSIDTMAGNTFANTVNNNIINIGCTPINYFYNTSGGSSYKPTVVSTGVVRDSVATAGNKCASSIPTRGGLFSTNSGIDPNTVKGIATLQGHYRQAIHDSFSIILEKLDFGNTDTLIAKINSKMSGKDIYTLLMSSPSWISGAALMALATSGKVDHDGLITLLNLNPDEQHDYATLDYLVSIKAIKQSDMDAFLSTNTAITWRTTLTHGINDLGTQASDIENVVMMYLKTAVDTNVSPTDTTGAGICTDSTSMYYLQDSLLAFTGHDSLCKWLGRIDKMWAIYDKAGWNYSKGNLTNADNIFKSIDSAVTAYNADTTERNTYRTLWASLYNAGNAKRTQYGLDSAELASLDTSSYYTFGPDAARQIITSLTITEYNPNPPTPIREPGCAGGGLALGPKAGHTPSAGPAATPVVATLTAPGITFSAYPNPATGNVTFSWAMSTAGASIHIVVSSIVGEKVFEVEDSRSTGSTNWQTATVPPGVYIYHVMDNGQQVGAGKMVVIK